MSPLPVAKLEELCIERDDEGKVRPIEAESSLLGRTIKITPLTYGFVRANDVLSVPMVDWPVERKVDALRLHMIEPNMEHATVEWVNQNMTPQVVDHLISLIVVHSSPFMRLQEERSKPHLLELLANTMAEAAREKIGESGTGE